MKVDNVDFLTDMVTKMTTSVEPTGYHEVDMEILDNLHDVFRKFSCHIKSS